MLLQIILLDPVFFFFISPLVCSKSTKDRDFVSFDPYSILVYSCMRLTNVYIHVSTVVVVQSISCIQLFATL